MDRVLILLVMVASMLLSAGPAHGAEAAPFAWQVGACYDLSADQVDAAVLDPVPAPVDCDGPHNVQATYVGPYSPADDDPHHLVCSPLSTYREVGLLTATMVSVGHGALPYLAPVTWLNADQTQLMCGAVPIAFARHWRPTGMSIAGRLDQYRPGGPLLGEAGLCVDGMPQTHDAVSIDCSRGDRTTWRLWRIIDLDQVFDGRWPGLARMQRYGLRMCGTRASTGRDPVFPASFTWDNPGQRIMMCYERRDPNR